MNRYLRKLNSEIEPIVYIPFDPEVVKFLAEYPV